MEVLIRAYVGGIFLIFITQKTVMVAGFSEIKRCGGSNKACRWKKFPKKNKICCTLIREGQSSYLIIQNLQFPVNNCFYLPTLVCRIDV